MVVAVTVSGGAHSLFSLAPSLPPFLPSPSFLPPVSKWIKVILLRAVPCLP